MFPNPLPGTDGYETLVEQLREHERRAAVAAVDCAEPLRSESAEVWSEYEAEFANQYEIPELPQSAS